MAAPDFRNLLNKPVGEVKRPVVLPEGTYYGVIASQEVGQSTKKKTPFVQFNVTLHSAHEDVVLENDKGEPISLEGKKAPQRGTEFYVTEESEYRLYDFLESLGIEVAGRTLGEMLPEAVGMDVQVLITQVWIEDANSEEGGRFVNNTGRLSAMPKS